MAQSNFLKDHGTMARTIGKLILLAICCIALFFIGVLGALATNVLIYGADAVDSDGAGFAG
jgi:hypothetical protein